MNPLLCERQLGRLPAGVILPAYDRAATRAGIVHLGVGAFHRAHQAWYTERVLNGGGGDWAIVGASLRGADVRDRLEPQDGLFTLVERDGNQRRCQVVGAIRRVLVGPEGPQALVEQMGHPDISIISLTITEKGYLYDAGAGGLQLDHPDIRADMARYPAAPVTAIGYLVAALDHRRREGGAGVTLLSCDNLPHNGRILQKVVTEFAEKVDPSLLPWIESNVTFPCSMVDRIVPATTDADLAELEQSLGVRDRAAVFTEPFSQWVIEDNFARGAPDWAAAGALLTDDVGPFESMKLRLLNGSHSLIAYLGYVAGYDYVHQVMADDNLHRLVRLYMEQQAAPTLRVPRGFDIKKYQEQLRGRFANAALQHRTYQIAQDGSQKIPQRWLSSVRELTAMQQPTTVLALAVAGWIRYLEGRRDNGETYSADDPMAGVLREALDRGERERGAPAAAVMELASVFGNLAKENPGFALEVCDLHRQLVTRGVAVTVATVF